MNGVPCGTLSSSLPSGPLCTGYTAPTIFFPFQSALCRPGAESKGGILPPGRIWGHLVSSGMWSAGAGGCSAAAIGEACSLNPGSAGRPSPGPPEPQYPRRHSEIGRGKKETCLFSLPLLSQLIWPGSCFFLLSPLTSCLFLMTHFWETAPETTISGFIHKGQRRQLHPAHPKRGKNPSRALASPCNGALLPPAPLPPAGCHGNAPSVRTGPSISSLHPSSPPSLCLQGLCTLSR